MGLGNPIRSYLGLLLFNGGGEATWLPPYMDRDNHRKAPSLEAYKLHSSNWLLVLPALIGKKRTICEITNQQHIRKHIPTRCVGLKLVTFGNPQMDAFPDISSHWTKHILTIFDHPISFKFTNHPLVGYIPWFLVQLLSWLMMWSAQYSRPPKW